MNALEIYLRDLRDIRASGAAVKETSYYGPLAALLNEIGKMLEPRVRCIMNLQDVGVGFPDGGLFTLDQLQKASASEPLPGQLPTRAEERDLSNDYRTTTHTPAPQGQGLNDLYVRFFRMAERQIAGRTGQGIVCLISNYSSLDGLSFPGMRERYLEVFDRIWVDCLNGDKYKTGKLTPEGEPDPSIFSTEFNPDGIQVGTAVTLLVRTTPHNPEGVVQFRHLWGKTKRAQLLETASQDGQIFYEEVTPTPELGRPFVPGQVQTRYFSWPLLPDLFLISSPGVKTSRDADLVEIDRAKIEQRIQTYFEDTLSDEGVRQIAPSLMTSSAQYNAPATRQYLIRRGIASGYFVSYGYRPFDRRHLYWHPETTLLDRKREDLFSLFRAGSFFLTSRQKGERQNEGTPFYITRHLPDWHLTRPGSICFPLTLNGMPYQMQMSSPEAAPTEDSPVANLSAFAHDYLQSLGISNPNADLKTAGLLWMHSLAVGYSSHYLSENAVGLRQDWPRIPLPDSKEGLLASATLGLQVTALLDAETPVSGISSGSIRSELRGIAVIAREGDGPLNPAGGDLAITTGWGHAGKGGITMPGMGKVVERQYSDDELNAIRTGAEAHSLSANQVFQLLGETTCDVYLNAVAYWRNVPIKVWTYTIGGYQIIKKWLSYRERELLGRPLHNDEAREVTSMARRIAAILLLQPGLDANYRNIISSTFLWPPPEVSGESWTEHL